MYNPYIIHVLMMLFLIEVSGPFVPVPLEWLSLEWDRRGLKTIHYLLMMFLDSKLGLQCSLDGVLVEGW